MIALPALRGSQSCTRSCHQRSASKSKSVTRSQRLSLKRILQVLERRQTAPLLLRTKINYLDTVGVWYRFTCRSHAVGIALHVLRSCIAPSVASYVVETTFLRGFESYLRSHLFS